MARIDFRQSVARIRERDGLTWDEIIDKCRNQVEIWYKNILAKLR